MRNLFDFIKRLIKWLPILWADKDWDFPYILKIYAFKIKCVRESAEKYWLEDRRSLNKKIKNMRTCELLLERMATENYCEEQYKELKPEGYYWGWGVLDKINSDKFININKKEEYMYKQDLELFCKIFSKHHKSWWD